MPKPRPSPRCDFVQKQLMHFISAATRAHRTTEYREFTSTDELLGEAAAGGRPDVTSRSSLLAQTVVEPPW